MASQFPMEDKALCYHHPSLEKVPDFAFDAGKDIFDDIPSLFNDGQPQTIISKHLSNANLMDI